jgi:hypothetical protein
MYLLKKCPLKRNDHNSCSLSLIWYYLFSCQDCGVFQIWRGNTVGISLYKVNLYVNLYVMPIFDV